MKLEDGRYEVTCITRYYNSNKTISSFFEPQTKLDFFSEPSVIHKFYLRLQFFLVKIQEKSGNSGLFN